MTMTHSNAGVKKTDLSPTIRMGSTRCTLYLGIYLGKKAHLISTQIANVATALGLALRSAALALQVLLALVVLAFMAGHLQMHAQGVGPSK